MKKTKKNKCKNCKGSGFVAMGTDMFGNTIKGLKECPICKGTGERRMTEEEKQVEISFCEKYLKYLRKPHFSWDILFRPLRIYYYSRKLKKLKQADKD